MSRWDAFDARRTPATDDHECVGCCDVVQGHEALCADCAARYDDLASREYPDLAADDAAWLDVAHAAVMDLARARRIA